VEVDDDGTSGVIRRIQLVGWLAGVVVAFVAIAVLPSVIVSPSVVMDGEARVKLQNEVRTTLLQSRGYGPAAGRLPDVAAG
jgi:hypothetical protein